MGKSAVLYGVPLGGQGIRLFVAIQRRDAQSKSTPSLALIDGFKRYSGLICGWGIA